MSGEPENQNELQIVHSRVFRRAHTNGRNWKRTEIQHTAESAEPMDFSLYELSGEKERFTAEAGKRCVPEVAA